MDFISHQSSRWDEFIFDIYTLASFSSHLWITVSLAIGVSVFSISVLFIGLNRIQNKFCSTVDLSYFSEMK